MSTLFAYIPAVEHTQRGHPENPNRLAAVMKLLESKGVLQDLKPVDTMPATIDQLTRVHSAKMVDMVSMACKQGRAQLDADTYITTASYEQALLAVGTTCKAVDEIMTGAAKNGFALVRPPGHHAGIGQVGGFCLFNNIAAAARQAQEIHGAEKILIIDFDVHHGNGTQDIFYADPNVLLISLHLYHYFFYPGSGAAEEIGVGAGRGATINIPFGPGAGDHWYERAFEDIVRPISAQFQPDIILVSAGYDAHWDDPLASANLSLVGYTRMVREILALADSYCEGRVLFVLEGGYHLNALAHGVLNTLFTLTGVDEISDPLGPPPHPEADMSAVLGDVTRIHLPT